MEGVCLHLVCMLFVLCVHTRVPHLCFVAVCTRMWVYLLTCAARAAVCTMPWACRQTRGLEAAAACGQLRNMHQKEPLSQFAVPS